MRYHVIFNKHAGLYRAHGQDYIARLVRDSLGAKLAGLDFIARQDVDAAFKTAFADAGDDCIVLASGGDGTLRSAVKQAWYNNKSFGPLPGGTFNALTRHLGLGHNFKKALQDYAAHPLYDQDVSIGTVNNDPFIEGVTLNLERAYLGKHKEGLRRFNLAQAYRIAVLFPHAVYSLLHDKQHYQYHLRNGKSDNTSKALLIKNNPFDPDKPVFDLFKGSSSRMNTGQLGVYSFSPQSWYDYYRIARCILGNRPMHQLPIIAETARQLEVMERDTQQIRLYIDGDPRIMTQPLHFASVRDAVRLKIPARSLSPD